MSETKKKPPKPDHSKCADLLNEAIAGDGYELPTVMTFNSKTMQGGIEKPFRIYVASKKSGKPVESRYYCSYCPLCGTKIQQ